MAELTENKLKEAQKDSSGQVSVEVFRQSKPGVCGPAALRTLLSHFGKTYTEEQLANLSVCAGDAGTEHEGMIQAVKEIGGFVFTKEEGSMEELEYFIKEEKLPVIIGWFDRDEDHYSVLVNTTDKNIIIIDPSNEYEKQERWIDRATFPRIWFDFVGATNRVVSWNWYMVVTFEKKKFKVKDGYY